MTIPEPITGTVDIVLTDLQLVQLAESIGVDVAALIAAHPDPEETHGE